MLFKNNFNRRHPFFIVALLFIAGLLLSAVINPISQGSPLALGCLCGSIITAFAIQPRLASLLAVIALGIFIGQRPQTLPHTRSTSQTLLAEVQFEKEKYAIVHLHLTTTKNDIAHAKVVIFKKEHTHLPNSTFLVTCTLHSINTLKTYTGFKSFLHDLDVRYYIQPHEITSIKHAKNNSPLQVLRSQVLDWIQNQWRKANLKETQIGLYSAIFLGDKSLLSNELKENFRNSGTTHLLVVSGLHIGIIYLIFSLLLRPLARLPKGKTLSQILSLVCIWAFIYLIGMSTAAVRAGYMISFYVLAQLLNRDYSLLNILSACLFINLLIAPSDLYAIGFQLSYGAVLGIAVFLPIWQRCYQPKNKIGRYFYEIIGVSVAVQVVISPLLAFYFGQIYPYSVISNLYAIPLSFMVLWSLVLSWFAVFVPVLFIFIHQVTNFVIELLLYCNNIVNAFPYAQLAYKPTNLDLAVYFSLVGLFCMCLYLKQYTKIQQLLTYYSLLLVGSLFIPF